MQQKFKKKIKNFNKLLKRKIKLKKKVRFQKKS